MNTTVIIQTGGGHVSRGARPQPAVANGLRLALLALVLAAFTPALALAHDGPEHELDELTERLKVEGESADLLLQRAVEYNVLNRTGEATKDLERALFFESHSPLILRELSHTYFSTGKTNEALDMATRGLKYAADGAERGSLYMARAEVLRAGKNYPKSLEDTEKAIQEFPEQCEWYLFRSQLQQMLGQKKERIAGLSAGLKETGSGLIEAEWLDALIEGGKAEQALGKIEEELQDSRLQSTWLLRRAKARIMLKKFAEAKADLEAALKEINERFTRGIDPLTLVDRRQIYEILGNKEEAKKDYEAAQAKGFNDEWLRERIKVVKGEDKKGDDKKKPGDAKKKEPPKESENKKGDDPEPNEKDKVEGDDQK